MEDDYYVRYRRRIPKDRVEFEVQTYESRASGCIKMTIDDSWVVPHSPNLLRKFRTRLNVELCISRVGSNKYLFQHICKVSDRVTVEIQGAPNEEQNENTSPGIPNIDEIRHNQDARYVSASGAEW